MEARSMGWKAEVQRRRSSLLDRFLMVAAVGGLAALIMYYVAQPSGTAVQTRLLNLLPFIVCWLPIPLAWRWRGMGYRARAWICTALAFIIAVVTFRRGGLAGSGRVWLLLLPPMGFVFLGPRSGIILGLVSGATYGISALLFSQGILEPTHLPEDMDALGAWGSEGASFLLVAAALTVLMRVFILNWLDALERTSATNVELEATNVQLQRQASQMQITAEIARAGSSILDPDALLDEVVNRIQRGFSAMGVYYVGLHLVEDAGGGVEDQTVALRAATGEAGRLLMAMGYRVRVNEDTAVGRCVAHREAYVSLDIEETTHLDVLPMPNTRSEIALPLRSRGRMLGALNAHSTHEMAFNQDDVAAMQILADQVAVSIDNAQLFTQTEAALNEVQMAHRRYLAESWRDFLAARPVAKVDYTRPGTRHGGDNRFLRNARRAAMVHGRTVATSSAMENDEEVTAGAFANPETALVVPLKLRGQIIGTMTLHEPDEQRAWTAQEVTLAETVVEQVALTIENLRLMDETQRRAAQEHTISAIADRLQRAPDIETLMQVTAEELNRALGGSRAYVRLSTVPQLSLDGNGHGDEGDIE